MSDGLVAIRKLEQQLEEAHDAAKSPARARRLLHYYLSVALVKGFMESKEYHLVVAVLKDTRITASGLVAALRPTNNARAAAGLFRAALVEIQHGMRRGRSLATAAGVQASASSLLAPDTST